MKKSLVVLIAMAFVLALSLPALAEVTVVGEIEKSKEKEVIEKVRIDKAHYVGVKQIAHPTNSAEAQAVKNDENTGNRLIESPIEAKEPQYFWNEHTQEQIELDPGHPAIPVKKNAAINAGVGDAASGVLGINQSPGSMNNQGNAVAVATSADGEAFLHAESSAEKINSGNVAGDAEAGIEMSERTNMIDSALVGVAGVVGVNQSAGSMNNQDNALSLAVGPDSIAALCEADLGMVNSGNITNEVAVVLLDCLNGTALAGASGIISVNQSSGCMNNQANVVAVCAVEM